jgi:predicted exporter
MKIASNIKPLQPLLWIFIFIFFWASLVVFFNKTPFKNELTQFFPLTNNIESVYLKNRLVPNQNTSWLMLSIQTDYSKNTLEEISQATQKRLLNINGVQQVLNGSEPVQSPLQQDSPPTLYPYRYLFTPFNPFQLKAHIQQRWQEYQLGFVLDRQWLLDDPSFQWGVYQTNLNPSQDLPKHNGVWFHEKTKSALLLVQTNNQADVLLNLQQQLESILGKQHFNLSGADWIAQQAQRQIKHEINLITTLALGMILIALFIAFRSPKLILLSSLPLLGAFSIGILSTISLFGSMQLITLALGAILLGVAIDYPIHIISAYQSRKKSSIEKIWLTVRLGALTSAFGFLTLWWVDIEGLQQISIFAASGLLAAIVITQTLKPYLANHYPLNISPPLPISSQNSNISAPNNLKFLTLGLLVISIILFVKPLQWQDDIASLSPVSKDLIQTDRTLRSQFEYKEVGKKLLLPAKDIESLLQKQEALIHSLETLKSSGAIQQYQLLAQILPSQQLQILRQKALVSSQSAVNLINEAVKNTRFKTSHFKPFQESLEQSKALPLITFDHFINSDDQNNQLAHQRVLITPNQVIGVIALSGVQSDALIQNFVQKSRLKELVYFNQRAFIAKQIKEVRVNLLQILGFLLIVLGGSIWLKFRNLHYVLTILSPIILAIGLTLATFSLLGIALSIFHLMSLMLVAAIGIDYSLLFAESTSEGTDAKNWTHSIHVAFFTTLGSFGILSLSQLSLLSAIGLTVVIGVSFSFCLAYVISKMTLRKRQRTI